MDRDPNQINALRAWLESCISALVFGGVSMNLRKSALWIFIVALGVVALSPGPARAVAFNWDFSTTSLVNSTGGTNFGNSLTFAAVGASSELVKVRAYSPTV